jgi:hypothetical protein
MGNETLAGKTLVVGRAMKAGFLDLPIDVDFSLMIRVPMPEESSLDIACHPAGFIGRDFRCNVLSVLELLDSFNRNYQAAGFLCIGVAG